MNLDFSIYNPPATDDQWLTLAIDLTSLVNVRNLKWTQWEKEFLLKLKEKIDGGESIDELTPKQRKTILILWGKV